MIVNEFIRRLDGVRKTTKGWIAKCPAHEDRSPSLSIAEGRDERVLLRCWAGCRTEEVVAALGLQLADLFPDSQPDPWRVRETQGRRAHEAAIHAARMTLAGIYREAEKIVQEARGLDLSKYSDEKLNRLVDDVAIAQSILLIEDAFNGKQ